MWQAARRAGYSGKTVHVQGPRLLANVRVAAAVEQARRGRMERTEINADWVLNGLVENVNRAMQATQVLDRKGEPTGEWQYDGSVANRGLELLGRHVGFFSEHSTVDVNVTHALDDASLDDLLALANDLKSKRLALQASAGEIVEGEVIDSSGPISVDDGQGEAP